MAMYAIGAFAKLTGVTPKSLYLYERNGLITPRRTSAGYRRYTMNDLQQLVRVLALKTPGLSLQEITRLRSGGARLDEVLARRRAALEEKREQIDRAVRAIDTIVGADSPDDALNRFVGQSNWDRWEAKRREATAGIERTPDRASPSRLALFRKIAASLDRDPSGAAAKPLVGRWHALLEAEAGGDADIAAQKRKVWASRHRWPDGMQRYVASLYDTEPDAWERVAQIIEQV